MTSPELTAVTLATLDRDRFVQLFGGVCEHAPWVAEQAFDVGPFHSLEGLHQAIVGAMRRVPRERRSL